jgi:hypothetical protein
MLSQPRRSASQFALQAHPPGQRMRLVRVMAKLLLAREMGIPSASAKEWASPPALEPKRGPRSAATMEAAWDCQWEGSMETLLERPMAAVMD